MHGGHQQVQALLHLSHLPRPRRWSSCRILLRQGHSGSSSSLMPYCGFGIYLYKVCGVHRLCVHGGYQQVQALLHLPVLPRHRRWISRRIFLRQGHSGTSSFLMPYFGFRILAN